MHRDVFIKNIVNDPISIGSRISLQINTFQGFLHNSVSEGDISDAVDLRIWRHSAYSQAHSQSNSDVFNQHILSAVRIPITVMMGRLGHNHVVVILTGDVIDVEIATIRINAVSIEGKERNRANQVESLEDIELCCSIDANVKIEDGYINRLVNFEMEAGRVLESQIMNCQFGSLLDSNQMGATGPSRHVLLRDEPTIQPPNVTPPVYLASTIDGNVIAEFYPDEVLVVDPIGVARPMLDAVTGRDLPLDLNHNIVAIVDSEGECVELALGDHHDPCVTSRF